MSDTPFEHTKFQDDEVVEVFVSTFSGSTHNFLAKGSDINVNHHHNLEARCDENGVGFKTINSIRVQDFNGHSVSYARKRRNDWFVPVPWDEVESK